MVVIFDANLKSFNLLLPSTLFIWFQLVCFSGNDFTYLILSPAGSFGFICPEASVSEISAASQHMKGNWVINYTYTKIHKKRIFPETMFQLLWTDLAVNSFNWKSDWFMERDDK